MGLVSEPSANNTVWANPPKGECTYRTAVPNLETRLFHRAYCADKPPLRRLEVIGVDIVVHEDWTPLMAVEPPIRPVVDVDEPDARRAIVPLIRLPHLRLGVIVGRVHAEPRPALVLLIGAVAGGQVEVGPGILRAHEPAVLDVVLDGNELPVDVILIGPDGEYGRLFPVDEVLGEVLAAFVDAELADLVPNIGVKDRRFVVTHDGSTRDRSTRGGYRGPAENRNLGQKGRQEGRQEEGKPCRSGHGFNCQPNRAAHLSRPVPLGSGPGLPHLVPRAPVVSRLSAVPRLLE